MMQHRLSSLEHDHYFMQTEIENSSNGIFPSWTMDICDFLWYHNINEYVILVEDNTTVFDVFFVKPELYQLCADKAEELCITFVVGTRRGSTFTEPREMYFAFTDSNEPYFKRG